MEGILVYFSRLMRPIWNRPLVNTAAFKFFVNEPIENFRREEVQVLTRRISEFKFWLENENKILNTSTSLSEVAPIPATSFAESFTHNHSFVRKV